MSVSVIDTSVCVILCFNVCHFVSMCVIFVSVCVIVHHCVSLCVIDCYCMSLSTIVCIHVSLYISVRYRVSLCVIRCQYVSLYVTLVVYNLKTEVFDCNSGPQLGANSYHNLVLLRVRYD